MRWSATRAGEFTMMPPTVASLRAIAQFATAGDALAAATAIIDVPTILPRIIAIDGGMRIALPGDDGLRLGHAHRRRRSGRLVDLPDRRHHRIRPGGHCMTERIA